MNDNYEKNDLFIKFYVTIYFSKLPHSVWPLMFVNDPKFLLYVDETSDTRGLKLNMVRKNNH